MWETNVRTIVSKIIANLREVKPNFEGLISAVSDLVVEVRSQTLARQLEPGDPVPPLNLRACDVLAELESLEAALSERNVPKALEHAEAALRVVG